MTLPTSKEVTSLFLYGKTQTPLQLADDKLIRPSPTVTASVPPIERRVDVNEYMTSGPGRFVSPASFALVRWFFSSPNASWLVPREYTQQELRSLSGTKEALVTQQQWAFDDGRGDYAERVYIWNSTAYEIDNTARFVVDANGDRWMKNVVVQPWRADNFDFKSNDIMAKLGNALLLKDQVDPSGIGRTVLLRFDGSRTRRTRYDYADYQSDAAKAVSWNPLLLAAAPGAIREVTARLFQAPGGPIRFLDSNNRPILYGTDGADRRMNGTRSVTGVDLLQHSYLREYVGNGIHYLAGRGNES